MLPTFRELLRGWLHGHVDGVEPDRLVQDAGFDSNASGEDFAAMGSRGEETHSSDLPQPDPTDIESRPSRSDAIATEPAHEPHTGDSLPASHSTVVDGLHSTTLDIAAFDLAMPLDLPLTQSPPATANRPKESLLGDGPQTFDDPMAVTWSSASVARTLPVESEQVPQTVPMAVSNSTFAGLPTNAATAIEEIIPDRRVENLIASLDREFRSAGEEQARTLSRLEDLFRRAIASQQDLTHFADRLDQLETAHHLRSRL